MNKLIALTIFFSAIISCALSIEGTSLHANYALLPFVPLTFIIVYFLFIHKTVFYYKSIIGIVFTILGVIRYIVTPIVISVTQNFGLSYIVISKESSYDKAFLLMIYEMCIISFSLYLFSSKHLIGNRKTGLKKLKGSKFVYIIFISIAFLLYMFYPGAKDLISFITIDVTSGERIDENLSTIEMAIRQILITATILLFLLLVNKCAQLYKRKKHMLYVYTALFVALFQVSIIIGERRTAVIYTAFACSFILLSIFKKHRKKILLILSTGAGIILAGMSIYKFFYAFSYNSYLEAIRASLSSGESGIGLANYLQLYFLGPQNIAATIEFENFVNPSFNNLFYDLGRAVFGLSFLVRDYDLTTTVSLFNTYIYGGPRSTGHLLSGIGYGYVYFGFILAPLFSVVLIYIAIRIERLLKSTSSLELMYLYAYILMRIAYGIFSSITAMLNVVTLMLITFGFVYIIGVIVNKSRSPRNIGVIDE